MVYFRIYGIVDQISFCIPSAETKLEGICLTIWKSYCSIM